MKKVYPPFTCKSTPQFSELLYNLNCSIALSTYQANKLILLSAKDEESIIQLPRHFDNIMGIAQNDKGNKLALACRDVVQVFANDPQLAEHYPKAPKKYDALFMPRMTYHTGALDIHDISFGDNEELYAVNTLFSCLMKLDSDYNFRPYWKPSWIERIASEDFCHLNGMAMLNGKPKYATAFNQGRTRQSWKQDMTKTGVIIDVDTNEVICEGLAMPHTPRVFDGKLYTLLSATGELICIDPDNKNYSVVANLNGFVRGMDLIDDYLFVGINKIRKKSSSFGHISFPKGSNQAAIVALHLPTGSIVGKLTYQNSVDEIYDIHVLNNLTRPNVLNTDKEIHKAGLSIPGQSFWGVVNEA
jgi:uncharacterized protein (TIGR03032 family)